MREGLAAKLVLPEVNVRVLQLNALAAGLPSTLTSLPGRQAGAASPLLALPPSPSAVAAMAPASTATWPGLPAPTWAPGAATSQTDRVATALGSGRLLLVQHQQPPFQRGRQLQQQAAGTGPASRWWNLTVIVTPQPAGGLQLLPFTAASAAQVLQQPGAGTEVTGTGDSLDDTSWAAGHCQPQAPSAAVQLLFMYGMMPGATKDVHPRTYLCWAPAAQTCP